MIGAITVNTTETKEHDGERARLIDGECVCVCVVGSFAGDSVEADTCLMRRSWNVTGTEGHREQGSGNAVG